jgi:hypothetical protein
VKLLLALAYQFNGRNNGDLTAAWSVMHEQHGFRSKGTLQRSLRALLDANLILQTRQSLFQHPNNQCSLYALTWLPIDECPGKRLDVSPTRRPPRKFSMEQKKSCPQNGTAPSPETAPGKDSSAPKTGPKKLASDPKTLPEAALTESQNSTPNNLPREMSL